MIRFTIMVLLFLCVFTLSQSQDLGDCRADSSKISRFISIWEGTPYKYGGDSERGIDCSALTRKAYYEFFGVRIPRTAIKQFKSLLAVEVSRPGDLVFFRSYTSPSGWHVGIWLKENLFFHAANRKMGVTISSLDDGTYRQRLLGWRRLHDSQM